MNSQDQIQLDAVVETFGRFGDRVAGTYYYGSGMLDVLRPNSDIDVFLLLDGSTVFEERQALVNDLMRVSGPKGTVVSGRPVEVTIARLQDLRP